MQRTAKIFCALIIAFCMLSFVAVGGAQAAGKVQVLTQLEAPMGHGSLIAFTILGNQIAKSGKWNFILRPQETPGYMYNIREMGQNKARWPNTCFGTSESLIQFAYTAGGTPALKSFLPTKIKVPWKLLTSLGVASQGMWYVTLDPKLKTIADLKGKRIGLGLRTQNFWGLNATVVLNAAYGINSGNSKISYLGPAKMTQALLDGKVDAICMGLVAPNTSGVKRWLPSSVYLKLKASGRKLNYIPIDPWAIKKINQKFGTTFGQEIVPKGTLKDQKGDLVVGAERCYIAAHPKLEEQLAYDYVMALIKTAPEVKEYSAIWKFVFKTKGAVSGLTEKNTHPGAIRAYKELGLWEGRTKFRPANLPE